MYEVGTGATPALSAVQRAHTLLDEGPPVGMSAPAAARYIERVREAVCGLGAQASPLVVRLLTYRVIAGSHVEDGVVLDVACDVADMAERLDDEVSRAHAEVAWCVAHPTPDHTDERVRRARWVIDVATRAGEVHLNQLGYLVLLVGLLEQGEIRSLDTELLEARTTEPEPTHASMNVARRFECLRSILDGDAEKAEAQADELLRLAELDGTDALALHTSQIGMIRWMQGRIDGVEEGFLEARRKYPEQVLWPASLAWLWLRQGRREAAEALLRSLPNIDDIPRDRYWLSTLTVLAEIATVTGTRDEAQQLRDRLLPFADRLVPVGIGLAFWGTAARTLGLLEERLGLLEQARQHLELAAATSARIGALAWHAEALIEVANFAFRHDIADVPAYELLAEARATSLARGFEALAARAMPKPRIRVLGRFEVISLGGVQARWTSRKARELLKMLVAARGVATSREVLMDVLWPGEQPEALANRFSVAVTVIRRAFDPDRLLPTQHHLVTEGESVRLDLENLDVDLERFCSLAVRDDDASQRAAAEIYVGDAFSEEPYADWAVRPREIARRLRAALTDS